jgi:CheY-like chemotaxis protein
LIEDNPGDVGLFNAFFAQNNERCRFHLAKDGEEALDFLLAPSPVARPHLIVLDINIPRISGTEVLKTLKAHPDLKTIPVVVLTSSESRDDLRMSFDFLDIARYFDPIDRIEGAISAFIRADWSGAMRRRGARSPSAGGHF